MKSFLISSAISQKFTRTFLVSSLLVVSASCSKTDDNKGSTPKEVVAENPLLSKVPEDSFLIATFNNESDGAKKFAKTPWADTSSIERQLSTIEQSSEQKIKDLIAAFRNSGLIGKNGQDGAFSQFTVFAGGKFPSDPKAGIYASARSGINLSEKITQIQAELKTKGFPLQDETFGAIKGFSFPLEKANQRGFVGASNNLLAVSLSAPVVARLFDSAITGHPVLLDNPKYKEALSKSAGVSDQFITGFLDLKPVVAQLAEQAPPGKESKVAEFKAKFPLDSVYISRQMGTQLYDQAMIFFQDQTPDAQTYRKAIDASSNRNLAGKVPASFLFLLSFDGKFIETLKNAVIAELPPEEQAPAIEASAPMAQLQSFGLAIKGNSAGTPFPDVVFVAESPTAPALKDAMKTALVGGISAAMGGGPEWQEKTVEGVPTTYLLTPFGPGAYISESKGVVIIASSESALQEILKTQAGTVPAITTVLDESTAKGLSQSKLPAMYYANISAAAGMLKGLQASLAMFTGGKSPVDQDQISALEKMGSVAGLVTYDSGALRIDQRYTPPPAK